MRIAQTLATTYMNLTKNLVSWVMPLVLKVWISAALWFR